MAGCGPPLGGQTLISMSATAQDWATIRQSAIFAALPEQDVRVIAGTYRTERYGKGQALFHEDDPATAFYVILDGWVLLSRDRPDGSRTVIKILGPRDSFAEGLISGGQTYPVSAEAAAPMRVARFDIRQFQNLIIGNPQIGLWMIAATFRQMRHLLDQIEHLKSWSVERRVAGIVLDMCQIGDGNSCCFDLPVDQSLIAARLSMTPHTLSRTLRKLSAIGVHAKYGRIAVQDLRRLRAFAAGNDDWHQT